MRRVLGELSRGGLVRPARGGGEVLEAALDCFGNDELIMVLKRLRLRIPTG
jgi:hypothetical protein